MTVFSAALAGLVALGLAFGAGFFWGYAVGCADTEADYGGGRR